jgi:hypothetical protein
MNQYVISFRIPFNVLNTRAFINGACSSDQQFEAGTTIMVRKATDEDSTSILPAEVIDTRRASRYGYAWDHVK